MIDSRGYWLGYHIVFLYSYGRGWHGLVITYKKVKFALIII